MLRFIAILAAFAITTGAFAPQSAQASCGDWLAHPGDIELASPERGGGSTPAPTQSCDGPLCQRAPAAPPSIPPAPAAESHSELACLFAADFGSALSQARVCSSVSLVASQGYRQGIERPPRG